MLNLPDNIIQALGVEKLNPVQEEAVKKGLLLDKNMVIASPTASGKTLIAEIAILKNFLQKGKTVYLVPLKALASEKYSEIKEKYASLGLRVSLSIGDLDSDDEWLSSYDVIIASNEKMDSMMRHKLKWIDSVNLVICDEIHLLNDSSRGPTLEIVLTKLMDRKIIALSATISNANDIANWLNATLVKSTYRPVKLEKGVFYSDNKRSVIRFPNKNYFLDQGDEDVIIKDTVEKQKQLLLFLSSRRSAEASAEKSGVIIKDLIDKDRLEDLAKQVETVLKPETRQCTRLANCVRKGTAFHHAGLVSKQRKLIEDGFKEGLIKVISATPTLAFGLNLPAWRVLIRDTKRYSNYGMDFIPVMDVHQMCGRAGRPKYDKEGEAIIIAKNEKDADELEERYLLSDSEDIYSKLSVEPVLRTHTLALICSGINSTEELEKFFSKTFFAYQYKNVSDVMNKVEKVLQELESYDFIEIKSKSLYKDFVTAFELDKSLKATKLGERVSQLYLDPRSANFIIQNLKDRKDIEHILTICHCPEIYPLLNVKKSEQDFIESLIAKHKLPSPDVWDPEYDEFLTQFKTSSMFFDWMNEETEDQLLEKYGIAPGEVYNKMLLAEWLFYSAKELAVVLEKKDIAKELGKLELRIKNGVKEELLKLVRIKGIGRARARNLYKNGIKDLIDIRNSQDKLEKILGKKIAENLLKEISQNLEDKMQKTKFMVHDFE